jgi:stage V sporulation protein G
LEIKIILEYLTACGVKQNYSTKFHYRDYSKEDVILMTITDIKIRKIIPDGRLRAVISITIDNMLAVHDIKVVQGEERLFVAMPSRKDESNNFRDIVHPISPEARAIIEGTILKAYEEHMAQIAAESEADEMGL